MRRWKTTQSRLQAAGSSFSVAAKWAGQSMKADAVVGPAGQSRLSCQWRRSREPALPKLLANLFLRFGCGESPWKDSG